MAGDSKQPGAVFSAADYNTLRQAAIRDSLGGFGVETINTGRGTAFAAPPQAVTTEHAKRMLYISGAPLPMFSLVHIRSGAGTPPEVYPYCEITDYSGRQQLGLLMEGPIYGDMPLVQYDGIGLVLWDRNSLKAEFRPYVPGSTHQGERLGARQASYMAQWDRNGPLLIINAGLEVPSEVMTTTAGGNVGLALVAIGQRYADTVFCHKENLSGDDEIEGPFSVWIFGDGYTIVENPVPGDIQVVSGDWSTTA